VFDMVTSVTGAGAIGQLLSTPVSAVPLATAVGTGAGGAQDSIHVSPEARMLLAIASLLGDGQGGQTSTDRLTQLAAALGPVVITGGDTTPSISVVQRDPGYADAALARIAAALRGGAAPTAAAPGSYFAAVRSGEGADTILLGDPAVAVAAAADGTLTGIVDSGAGDDLLKLNGNVLAQPGLGNDRIELASGSLLLSFSRGDGEDSVTLGGGTVGVLLEDVAEADLKVSRNGADLVLRIHDTNDSITFRNYDPVRAGWVRFNDGTRSIAELAAALDLSV
jgi:hypothetical protein